MTALCPARNAAGRQCERWNLPAAHTDGNHRAGKAVWPVQPIGSPTADPQGDLLSLLGTEAKT